MEFFLEHVPSNFMIIVILEQNHLNDWKTVSFLDLFLGHSNVILWAIEHLFAKLQ